MILEVFGFEMLVSGFCKDGWWLENWDVDKCLMEIHVKLRKSVQQLMNPKKSLTNHNKSANLFQ